MSVLRRAGPRLIAWFVMLAGLVGLAGLASSAWRSEEARAPILITATPWIGNAPLMEARARKLFGNTEVRLIELSTDFDGFRAMRERRADMTTGTLFDMLRFLDHGVEMKLVMTLDFSKGADGIVGREGISSIEDLRGRTIAVEKSTLTHFVVIRALERVGLREEDVVLANMPMDEAMVALDAGKIDAAALWEPQLSQAKKPERRLLFSSAEIPGEIVDVVGVRSDVLQNRPDAVVDVLKGFDLALDLFSANPQETVESVSHFMRLSPAETKEALDRVEILSLSQNERLFDPSSAPSLWKAYALAATFMETHGMLRHPARAAKAVLDEGPLRRAIAARK